MRRSFQNVPPKKNKDNINSRNRNRDYNNFDDRKHLDKDNDFSYNNRYNHQSNMKKQQKLKKRAANPSLNNFDTKGPKSSQRNSQDFSR